MRRSGVGDVLERRVAGGMRAGRRSPYSQSMTRTVATWCYTEVLTIPALAAEMLESVLAACPSASRRGPYDPPAPTPPRG